MSERMHLPMPATPEALLAEATRMDRARAEWERVLGPWQTLEEECQVRERLAEEIRRSRESRRAR